MRPCRSSRGPPPGHPIETLTCRWAGERVRFMTQVHVNGVRLYREEHGHGAPILCIHGTSSSAMVWRPAAIEELSALRRVILYDRRGCTRGERPDPYETSVAQHAEDAATLLLALDAVPAVGIGRSYGGEMGGRL